MNLICVYPHKQLEKEQSLWICEPLTQNQHYHEYLCNYAISAFSVQYQLNKSSGICLYININRNEQKFGDTHKRATCHS